MIEVPVKTLAEILEAHGPMNRQVDLLNVDVEGLDEQVLQSNDWSRFQPRLVLVERHGLSYEEAVEDSTVVYLKNLGLGYNLVTKCGPTLILQRTS